MKQTLKKTLVGLLFLASFILVPSFVTTAFVAKDLPDATNPCNTNLQRECDRIARPSSGGGTGGGIDGGSTIPTPPTPPTEPSIVSSHSSFGSVKIIVLQPEDWNNDLISYDKSCVIKLGDDSCSAGFSWRIFLNSWENFAITTPQNFLVSSKPQGVIEGYKIEYPSRNFFFYKNGTEFHSINISAKCDPATSTWSSIEKKCVKSTETEQDLCPNTPGVQLTTPCPDPRDNETCFDGIKNQTETGIDVGGVCDTDPRDLCPNTSGVQTTLPCPDNYCPPPTTKTVTVSCDPKEGLTVVSGSVTRILTKDPNTCTFGSPTVINEYNDYSSDNCKYTKKIDPSCFDGIKNQNETGIDVGGVCDTDPRDLCPNTPGVQLTTPCPDPRDNETCFDGIKNQTETGIDVGGVCDTDPRDLCPNTSGVQTTLPCPGESDLCPNTNGVQTTLPCPDNYCPSPTTQNVIVNCDTRDGLNSTSGSVTRSQAKDPNTCTFGSPVTVNNSKYVSDTCVYPCLPGNFWDPSIKDCRNPAVSFSARDCRIELGKNNCLSSVDWSISINKKFDITTPDHILVANQNSPIGEKSWIIEYPSRSFYLYEEGSMDPTIIRTANAQCQYETEWDATEKKCVKFEGDDEGDENGAGYWGPETCGECNPSTLTMDCTVHCFGNLSECSGNNGTRTKVLPRTCRENGGSSNLSAAINVDLSISPERMIKGKTAILRWTSIGATECRAFTGVGYGDFSIVGGDSTEGGVEVTPTVNTKYKIQCFKGSSYNEDTAEIKVYNINIKEI